MSSQLANTAEARMSCAYCGAPARCIGRRVSAAEKIAVCLEHVAILSAAEEIREPLIREDLVPVETVTTSGSLTLWSD
jgi:hypothetical protein